MTQLWKNQAFTIAHADDGKFVGQGLRAFFDEVAADTPRLRAALSERGLLRRVDLPLDALRRKHFPDFTPDC